MDFGEVPELEGFILARAMPIRWSMALARPKSLAELVVDGKPGISIDEASILRFR